MWKFIIDSLGRLSFRENTVYFSDVGKVYKIKLTFIISGSYLVKILSLLFVII